ncbi:MAG TPA: site-specific integrase, partial [Bacteroidia bacterium]|nr:site-specific integrase [Bacteroidia bacterium]
IILKAELSDDPEDEPTREYVKKKYNELKSKKKTAPVKQISFWDFVNQFIQDAEGTKRAATIKTYKSARTYLQGYEKKRNIKLDWNSFDLDFPADFKKYFHIDKDCADNTYNGAIKNVKVWLNEAYAKKINVYDHYKSKKYAVSNTPSDNIYLTAKEIDDLVALDLSHDKKLDRVRDLFVLACCCGLRYSDFSILREENFAGNRLRIKTSKTGAEVVIPLHPHIVAIKAKYKNEANGLPRSMSNQKFNEYLKQLGKMAGITRNVNVHTYKGPKVTEETKQAWELISTHTARRSFATNLFKTKFPAISIMKITGHTTEKAFMRYIKVGLEENADLLEMHWEKFYQNQKQVA